MLPLFTLSSHVGHKWAFESGTLSSSGWERKEKKEGGQERALNLIPMCIVS